VVVEHRLAGLGELLAALFDVRRRLDLLFAHRYLQIIGTYRDPAERHKGQVGADEAFLDGRELLLDVDVLQLLIFSPSRSTSILPCLSRASHSTLLTAGGLVYRPGKR
jgi:hypothetical protein